jgi:hypothetical protein
LQAARHFENAQSQQSVRCLPEKRSHFSQGCWAQERTGSAVVTTARAIDLARMQRIRAAAT